MRSALARALLLTIAFLIAVALSLGSATAASAELKFPEPKGYINDFAGMISAQTARDLEVKLRGYKKNSGNEIAVVTVNDLQGTDVEDFGVRLFEKWKIGEAGKNNGVLLLVSKQEHKIRIEVGYGLEPDVTDAEAFNIIRDTISPAFKQGDYDKGVTAGVDAIIAAVSGDNEPGSGSSPQSTGLPATNSPRPDSWAKGLGSLLFPVLFIGFAALQWLISVLGRTKSWWLGGVIGAGFGLLLLIFSPLIGIIAMVLLAPIGLLFDLAVSRAYGKRVNEGTNAAETGGTRTHSIPWWAGGNWGPGGIGGGFDDNNDSDGDFGDFGGFGGGESGGGGASGGW